MEIKPTVTTKSEMTAYASLLGQVFPSSPSLGSVDYLGWLYRENPLGLVVGSDAWVGDELAAHYVCIPVLANVEGRNCRGLLSLNTVTNPKYQGKGLFTKLAQHTFEAAANSGFEFVYGVANANSTPGFLKKLGFQLVSPLQAKIGFGNPVRLNMANGGLRTASFQRTWDSTALNWRIRNPSNPCQLTFNSRTALISARTPYPLIQAVASVDLGHNLLQMKSAHAARLALGLYLGLTKAGENLSAWYLSIPEKLKPSPLNLIYKSLGNTPRLIDPRNTSISYLDFDAY